jgi:hypothetical protein
VTCPDIPQLLAQAFRLEPGLPTTAAPGQAFFVVAERVPGVTNALTTMIDNHQVPVTFRFKVSGIPDSDIHTTPNFGTNPQPSPSTVAMAIVRPDLFAKEQPAPAARQFTVQLQVTVTIAPCGEVTFDAGAALQFGQLPLGVATIATFFEDSGFGGAPMIVTPAGTLLPGIAGQKFDHNNSGPLTGARNTVADELFTLSVTCSLLSFFAGIAGIPGSDELDLIGTLVTKIRDASLAVVDGRGSASDLEDAVVDTFWWRPDRDFDDEAGSMILIAAPGFGSLDGFADSGFGPNPPAETWGMPDGHIVAAIPDFEEMRSPTTVGPTSIALPYADPGDSRSDDFDDEMGSFRFN